MQAQSVRARAAVTGLGLEVCNTLACAARTCVSTCSRASIDACAAAACACASPPAVSPCSRPSLTSLPAAQPAHRRQGLCPCRLHGARGPPGSRRVLKDRKKAVGRVAAAVLRDRDQLSRQVCVAGVRQVALVGLSKRCCCNGNEARQGQHGSNKLLPLLCYKALALPFTSLACCLPACVAPCSDYWSEEDNQNSARLLLVLHVMGLFTFAR